MSDKKKKKSKQDLGICLVCETSQHKIAFFFLRQEDKNKGLPIVISVVPLMCKFCFIVIWKLLGKECMTET